jgi:glycosyltransferase 2 family protein
MDEPRAVNVQRTQRPTARISIPSISFAIVVAVVLYVAMATLADWNVLSKTLSSIPAVLWLEVVALSLLSYSTRFLRWYLFLGALGYAISVKRNLEIYLSGFALTLTPGKAGEAIRSIYLRPYGVSYAASIGALIAERLLDLVAVGLLACLGMLVFPEHRLWTLGAVSFCTALIIFFRSHLLTVVTERLARRSLGKHTAITLQTMNFLLSGSRLGGALPLSFLAWTAQGFSLYLIVYSLGFDLSATSAIAIYSLSILAGAASFIPGGIGATEAAIALLLSAAGMNQGDAITAALVSRGLTLWLAVGIGVLAMGKIAITARSERRAV